MIRHFAADGSVKREWSEGLHASPAVRDGKLLTQVQGSNAVLAEIELADGEQVGESFVAAIANTLAAADVKPFTPDVHPIESAITAIDEPTDPISVPAPIAGATTEHHPSPSEVVAAAAHALNDAAEVLKEEEAHQAPAATNEPT